MIELHHYPDGQPVLHVKESDAPTLYALVTWAKGHSNPETHSMTISVLMEEEYEEIAQTVLTGRAGLITWYIENVGYSPDEDRGSPTPILELVDLVASHLLLRAQEKLPCR